MTNPSTVQNACKSFDDFTSQIKNLLTKCWKVVVKEQLVADSLISSN